MAVDMKMVFGSDADAFRDITNRLLDKYDDARLADLYQDIVAELSIERGHRAQEQRLEAELATSIKEYAIGRYGTPVRKGFTDEDWKVMAHILREDLDSFVERVANGANATKLLESCSKWKPGSALSKSSNKVEESDDEILHAWLERYVY